MIKYFTLILYMANSIFWCTLSLICSFIDSTGKKQEWCAYHWGKSCLDLTGVKVSATGLSNIEGNGPFIFAPNHQSYLDIWVSLYVLPRNFRFLAKESLFKWPFIGWHLTRAGHIPIAREDSKSGAKSLLNAVKKIKNGTNVLIFPEGTRGKPNTLGEFKKGAFLLAAKTGVPLIPIIMRNTANLFPGGSFFVYPGNVEVTILPPIDTSAFGAKKSDELMEHTKNIMENAFYGANNTKNI